MGKGAASCAPMCLTVPRAFDWMRPFQTSDKTSGRTPHGRWMSITSMVRMRSAALVSSTTLSAPADELTCVFRLLASVFSFDTIQTSSRGTPLLASA